MRNSYRSGYWLCTCGFVVESQNGKPGDCPSHPEQAGYPDDLDPGWEPLVRTERLPPEGEWGDIECARCGHEFVGLNDGVLWFCQECHGHITTREPSSAVCATPSDSPKTEQTTLVAETDGGNPRPHDTDIERSERN